jgi:predicted flap endonuclease-1-like 5' DNA nuclease
MDFEVIEFSKDAKRIIVSHTNLWKGAERERVRTEKDGKEKARRNASKAVKKINQTQERSTMGELDALSELRAQLEQAERASAQAAAAKAEKPAAAPKAEKAAEAPKTEKAAASGKGDLKSLSGLGPAMEKRLAEQGVASIADLTALDEAKIAAIVEADSKISADSLNKWIAEAKG